jgi:hypothetical protein
VRLALVLRVLVLELVPSDSAGARALPAFEYFLESVAEGSHLSLFVAPDSKSLSFRCLWFQLTREMHYWWC